MARQASSKPADSTAILGFDADFVISSGLLAIINFAIRGIEATAMRESAMKPRKDIMQSVSNAKDHFGAEHADTFRRDLHPNLRADHVLANPPFNDSDVAQSSTHSHGWDTVPRDRRSREYFKTYAAKL